MPTVTPDRRPRLPQPLVVLTGLVLVISCVYFARRVLIPIALAVLLTFRRRSGRRCLRPGV